MKKSRTAMGLAIGAALIGGVAAAAPLGMRAPAGGLLCSIDPPIEFTARRTRRIVAGSEAVVRATAIGAVPAPIGSKRPDGSYVAFSVVEVLKGEAPDKLVFLGAEDDRDSFQEGSVPYLGPHRWYGGGDCLAMTYRPGAEYLLLLGRREDQDVLDPYWQLLAPTNEQVRGADDPWVRWVRREIAAGARGGG